MKKNRKKCISVARLEELTEGDEQTSPEKQHLQSCRSCQKNLQEMAKAEDLLKSLRIDIRRNYGLSFSRYHSCHRLAEGGMSVIFSALDPADNEVIVKVCRTPEFLSYFRDEVERFQVCQAAGVTGVVELVDCDLDHQPAYMVFPFVAKGSLATYLDESGAMPANQLATVAMTLAQALASFDDNGLVHGCVKPANILLTENDAAEFSHLGSSGEMLVKGQNYTLKTGSASIPLSTVAYMSPEQVSGDEPTAHSDAFSVGVILYELATNVHPFFAERSWDMAENILSDGIDELPEDVPKGLSSFIYSCLAKDPELRPNTIQLATITEELLRGDLELLLGANSPDQIGLVQHKWRRILWIFLLLNVGLAVVYALFALWKAGYF